MTVSTIDFAALARELYEFGTAYPQRRVEERFLKALTQSHASGHAKGLEDAAKWRWAACRLLNAVKALIAGTVGARQIADDAVAEASALASSDPAPRDQVAK